MKLRPFLVVLFSVATYAVLIWYFADVVHAPSPAAEKSESLSFFIVAFLAILGNIRIIQYHATVPPHPKFLLVPKRKFWIRVHALTGSIEVILGVVAWFTEDKSLALATAGVALLGHVPSSYFQTPGVFGTKGIMVPAYFGVVTMHAYCAVRLVMEGGDIIWLERTWMALQAYAYVRIFGLLLQSVGAFKDSIYTVSVVLAGAAITPFILGPAGMVCILFVVMIYLGWFWLIMRPNAREWHQLFEEKERRSLIDTNMRNLWIARHLHTEVNDSSIQNARLVFDHLDSNRSGKLTLAEVTTLMQEWGASADYVHAFFHHYGDSDGINFETFVSTLWISGRIQEQLTDKAAASIREPEQQARFIFNHLDLNSSGYLDLAEIEMLLLEWGMTAEEAEHYLDRFGGADKKIDFIEFYRDMKPVWKFGFSEIFS